MRYFLGAFFYLAVISTNYGQVKYFKGLKFDLDNYNKIPKKASLIRGNYEKLPDSVSLKKYSPFPGNQLRMNTSASWAAVYGAKTILDAESGQIIDRKKITYNAYSPVFNYALSTNMNNRGCSSPTTLIAVLESLKQSGVPRYIDFQVFCPDTINQADYNRAQEHKITDFVRLFDPNDAPEFKLETMKKSLAEGNPVIIGMGCPPSFSIAKEFWQPREKMSLTMDGQALCVVGYNGNKYGGAFEVMNSWGRDWGNDGYIWVRYSDFIDFTVTAYEMFMIDQDLNRVDFSGEIKLVQDNGALINTQLTNDKGYYQTNSDYASGTKFRIYLSNDETAYVYVFGTDQTNAYFPLFPYDENISSILNYKNSSLALPSENLYIQITGEPGTDYLVILYSKEEIHLKDLMDKMQNTAGRVDERLQSILSNSIVNNKNIKWDSGSIKFSGTGNGKTLVPVFVEIKHN